MAVEVRIVLLPIVVMAFVGGGYPRNSAMTESKPEYSILQPGDVAKVPVILEGLVIADGIAVAPVQNSPIDSRPVQLWKARVHVENLLQGEIDQGDVDVFYFIGDIPGSARSIRLRSGERNIFFLRRDGTKLRTNDDRSANGCLLTVMTGPHPNFTRAPGVSINQAIIELLLTRGSGVDDKKMIAAIDEPNYSRFISEEQIVRRLQQVAEVESPVVREAACLKLLFGKHPCGHEQETPAVTIRNLTHPDANGTFRPGDQIRTILAGAAHQTVYRSGTGRVGVTDEDGRFTLTETLHHPRIGARTDVWLVGTEEISPAVSYVAGMHGPKGDITTTAIGNLRDRHGMGISALSVLGDTVITYSGMLLDYRTGLYYDAQEADTLYEDGKPIKNGRISGEASARQLWETKVKSWNDYFLQGGHYAVAAFQAGAFANPMKFSAGSCFGTSSNCQIVPLDGPAQTAKAAIFLGNTGADQSAVPQSADWALKGLDLDSKAELLEAVLIRPEGADDAHMIGMIDEVAREHEFGNDLIVKKLQEVAGRETPAVRAEACSVLRRLRHPCGKRSSRAPTTPQPAVVRQKTKPAAASAVAYRLETAIPKYLVFAHFLLMIHGMDEKKFVAAFGLKWLSRVQLDALTGEASALTQELARLDLRAHRVTAEFRRTGRLALREGKPLPPPPTEICRLQAMRTAAMVNHAVSLQARLGTKEMLNLEAMLAYQFTPLASFGYLARGDRTN
jgi:hypothetical protein